MVRAIVLALLALWPAAGGAQGWQLRTFDDGVFFGARIAPAERPERPGMAMLCAQRRGQGSSAGQGGDPRPETTRPDVLRVYFSPREIGAPAATGVRSDVMVVAGATGYAFAQVAWNRQAGTWQADLPADDPVFGAIAAEPAFELRSQGGSVMVTGSGFETAFNALVTHCRRQFAAIGKPWRGAVPPAAPIQPASMRALAEAAVSRGCKGPATLQPGALLEGEIDGDGITDVVLDWRSVDCPAFELNPFCGASMCSADVYLSSVYPRRAQPESLLALGVRLQPLSNGNMAVAVGGSLGMCRGAGATSCEFLFYWNGADLVELP